MNPALPVTRAFTDVGPAAAACPGDGRRGV